MTPTKKTHLKTAKNCEASEIFYETGITIPARCGKNPAKEVRHVGSCYDSYDLGGNLRVSKAFVGAPDLNVSFAFAPHIAGPLPTHRITLVTWSVPVRLQVPVNYQLNNNAPTKTFNQNKVSDYWGVR